MNYLYEIIKFNVTYILFCVICFHLQSNKKLHFIVAQSIMDFWGNYVI